MNVLSHPIVKRNYSLVFINLQAKSSETGGWRKSPPDPPLQVEITCVGSLEL